MGAFILKRFLAGIGLAYVVLTGMYFFLQFTGIDPARGSLGLYATVEQVNTRRQQLGLDRSAWVQYWEWFSHAIRGDLGTSFSSTSPVSELISSRFPVTLSLAVGAVAVAAFFGILLGTLAAIKPGIFDRFLQVVMVFGFALPNFWVAIILAVTLAVGLRWFPATGYVQFGSDPVGWLHSITLPVVAIAVGSIASIAQQLRNSIIKVNSQDYVRTLRSRGLSQRDILLTHVLRNAAPPALTMLSLQFIAALSGAAIVERVFGLQGLGSVAINASAESDLPVIMGLLLFTVITVVVVNLIIDILYGALNPKARIS